MKDQGRKDVERSLMDFERDLERLDPVAVPAGLRRRVLDRAAEARGSAMLPPKLRVVAAVCSIIIIAVVGLDPLIRKHETARLAALLDGRNSTTPVTESTPELAEALSGRAGEYAGLARLRAAVESAGSENTIRSAIEARKRLKGWVVDETSEDPD